MPNTSGGVVIALAGRRIDAPGAQASRFPASNVEVVSRRLEAAFRKLHATALVCSAACGADLLASRAAASLGMRRRVVLPFAPEVFRRTSVTDRPGAWGEFYDQIVGELMPVNDVVVLDYGEEDPLAYPGTNVAILDEAERVAQDGRKSVVAVMVWEGTSRGSGDLTEHFSVEAGRRGIAVEAVSTTE